VIGAFSKTCNPSKPIPEVEIQEQGTILIKHGSWRGVWASTRTSHTKVANAQS